MDTPTILLLVIAYKAAKRSSVGGIDRPVDTKTKTQFHPRVLIAIGQVCYLFALLLLLNGATTLFVPSWVFHVLVIGGFIVADVQDIIYRRFTPWLYTAILTEFVIWAAIGLLALMSAYFVEGVLFFVAAVSKIVDLFSVYNIISFHSKTE